MQRQPVCSPPPCLPYTYVKYIVIQVLYDVYIQVWLLLVSLWVGRLVGVCVCSLRAHLESSSCLPSMLHCLYCVHPSPPSPQRAPENRDFCRISGFRRSFWPSLSPGQCAVLVVYVVFVLLLFCFFFLSPSRRDGWLLLSNATAISVMSSAVQFRGRRNSPPNSSLTLLLVKRERATSETRAHQRNIGVYNMQMRAHRTKGFSRLYTYCLVYLTVTEPAFIIIVQLSFYFEFFLSFLRSIYVF